MKITALGGDEFVGWKHGTHIDLPASGILLVTGPNGSGKSTCVEAASFALFGSTLRGPPPWTAIRGGGVLCRTDRLIVERSPQQGPKRVRWSLCDDKQPIDFESGKHAESALLKETGSWALWRHTHVFTSSDSARFATATDAERKRLIEEVLCLTRFDHAHGNALAASRTATSMLDRAQQQLAAAQAAVDAAASLLEKSGRTPSETAPLKILQFRLENATATAERLDQAVRANSTRYQDVRACATAADRGLASIHVGTCDTCGQTVTDDYANARRAELEQERDRACERANGLRADLDDATEQVSNMRIRIAGLNRSIALQEAADREDSMVQRARAQMAQAEQHVVAAERSVDQAKCERDTAQVVADVLSTKGVRAYLMDVVLGGVQTVANEWLDRFGMSGLSIRLSPYSMKQDGGTKPAIALEVQGAGGGQYDGCSSGERRRIDLAMMFALADVAAARSGRPGAGHGTMFMDEVLDALDVAGTTAVVDAIKQLARTRAVVLISHSRVVAELLGDSVRELRFDGRSRTL